LRIISCIYQQLIMVLIKSIPKYYDEVNTNYSSNEKKGYKSFFINRCLNMLVNFRYSYTYYGGINGVKVIMKRNVLTSD